MIQLLARLSRHVLALATLLWVFNGIAQAQSTITIDPNTNCSIKGTLKLDRIKFFNLATTGNNFERTINNPDVVKKYLDEYKMSFGRTIGGMRTRVVEDSLRPGYMDINDFKSNVEINFGESTELKNRWSNLDVVYTGNNRFRGYPSFMPKYKAPGNENESFPDNIDAAAEMTVTFLKYGFNDWNRPAMYEIVNEPAVPLWGDKKFADLHSAVCQKAKEAGIKTLVGGPCIWMPYFYKDNYNYLDNITKFIDNSSAELDFYAFHIYDFLQWNETAKDFRGEVTAGLPLEGVFDALENYTVNNYQKEVPIVVSEHGFFDGAVEDSNNIPPELAVELIGPGSGFEYEMKHRSIHCFLMASCVTANTMTFMNNMHIVRKAVPFILLQSTGWNPRYYASLLVPENFEKGKPWRETELINFYKLFSEFNGRRVLSFCEDPDIQYNTFVEGKNLFVALNNLSTIDESIKFDIANKNYVSISVKRHGRNEDFTPYFTESELSSLGNFIIKGREAVVLKLTYNNEIETKHAIDEVPHYADKVKQVIEPGSSQKFTVVVPEYKLSENVILRIGVGRASGSDHKIDVKFNGSEIDIPMESIAAEYLDDEDYGSTKIVKIDPKSLMETNTVEISFPDGKSGGIGAVVLRVGAKK